MLSRLFVIVSALAFLSSTQAASTFVGCVLQATVALTADYATRTASQSACNTRCIGQRAQNPSIQYSYFVAGTLLGNNCYCDSIGSYTAASAYILPSGDTTTDCSALGVGLNLGLLATATDLTTTFEFQGCTNTLTGVVINLAQGTILGGAIVQDPQACFQRCAGNLNAYFIPIVPSITAIAPTYGCVCDPSGPGALGACGLLTFFKYTHSASASQQAQARKRAQKALESERRKSFCPGKMTSCLIPGVEDSWECVDPQSDLESCGGCAHGEYTSDGPSNSTATGLDCTNMPGVLRGGSTCTNGECVAFACKRKWTLLDGKCVRGLSKVM
ncbi:hypothetical protein I302_100817 [Kwoniella bestiolae CBS 10118]|uniref:Protein CPL1-like domain-containing protein n=1 Tax=Kwoniella bestiolae CBS 10118 TaxID=1296100 RepID=A0A1B9G637_9TREE|nr:hypothetical protein I302_04190 [Kwoniella bestiolae CBS 10118]OCF26504.1 hypothetical protein I302_04190 [Kwoniella bestiolae CBS 10118]